VGEFIARLATHIPGHHERLIRYYGHYSSRARGARRAAEEVEAGVVGKRALPTRWKRQWQQLLQRVFHVALCCPTCGREMKVLAFITEGESVRKILEHLRRKGIDARAGPFRQATPTGHSKAI